jgi:hypothetical protein
MLESSISVTGVRDHESFVRRARGDLVAVFPEIFRMVLGGG